MHNGTPLAKMRTAALSVLPRVPLFQGLFSDEYERLLEVCKLLRLGADQTLIQEGDLSRGMYVVLSGEVVVVSAARGELNRMGAGAVIGEIGLLREIRRTAGVRCVSDSVFIYLQGDGLHRLLGTAPRAYALMMRNIAASLAERVIALSREG